MMSAPSGVSSASAAGSRRVRAALVAGALVIIALGALYWSYVQRRTEYLVNRDLRLLSIAGAQIGTTLESRKQIVRNFAETQFWCGDGKPIDSYPSKAADDLKLAPYLANFTDLQRGAAVKMADAVPESACEGGYCVTQENANVRIEYHADVVPHSTPDTGGCPVAGYPRAVGRFSLDSLVTPVLDKPLFGVFDTVLIATSSGEVVKQIQPHGAQGRRSVSSRDARLTAGQDTPSSLVLATLKSIVDRSSKDGKPVNLDALRNETRSSDVEISGVRYFLLTQPYAFAAPSGGGSGAQHWIIAGLVARPHFMRDATEISMSLIELVVAGLVLLVCCWPFMKLAFSGPGEPVTRADVVMGGVATLLGGGMLALLFADVFAYGRIESTGDFQQRAFAAVMHEDMRRGIEQIVRIGGRMRELTLPYAIAYERGGKTHSEGDFKRRLPADLTQPYAYGFFSGAAWVNDLGEQVVQVAMKQGPPPLPSVARRQYFHILRDGGNAHPWTWLNPFHPKQPSTEFVIESVRTLATGASEAVMAFPVRSNLLPDLHVFTVAFPFVEVGSHVGSPDLTYSIIDQNGDVVFGSESDRNGIENVFTETDQDRKLRAAVNARQEDFVDTTYWGEDVRVLVTPLEDLPWTLLTFRDKRVLRTMNLDTLMMTIILFLFYLGAIVLIVVAVLLLRPSYHMPWVWPIERRLPHWSRVRLLYIVSGIAFVIAVFALAPGSRLAVACLVPFYGFLGTYLVLHEGPKRIAYALTVVTWTALNMIFAWGCVKAPVAWEVVGPVAEEVSLRALMLLCLLVAFLCVVVRAKELDRVRWREFSRTYIACGVLFIILVAVLPMIACFQAALTIESEALVKSGQRRMVDLFLQRIETLAQNSWCDTTNVLAGYPIPFFYESNWCIQAKSLDKPCGDDSTARISNLVSAVPFRPADDKVGDLLEEYFPVYSEDSLDMRGLHSGKGDDGSWQTVRARRVLALSRKFDLSDVARTKLLAQFRAPFNGHLAPALLQLVGPIGEKRAWLTIVSRVPSLLPDWLRAKDPIRLFPQNPGQLRPGELTSFPGPAKDPEVPGAVQAVFFLFAAGIAFSGVRWAVRFAAQRIVLYDLREPRWLDTPLRPPLGEHVFLVHTPDNLEKLICMDDVERRSFDDLREIEPSSDDDVWRPPAKSADWLALVDSGPKRAILCEGFGDGLSDVALTKRKFALIESMMQLTDCTLIISSPVSPALFLNLYDDLDPATRARWAAVLSTFVWIDETRLLDRGRAFAADESPIPSAWERTKTAWRTFIARAPGLPKRLLTRLKPSSLCMRLLQLWKWCLQFTAKGREERDRADDQNWITSETEPSTFLQSFADRLRSLPGGREQMLDELRERADRYYQALWKMCSPSERRVLYHVAHFGVANCNNRRQIRRLLARGLLRRDGELRLFNTTFRLFVLARGDEIRAQCENEPEGRSTFDRVRVPLLIGVLVVLGALLGTQKDLANATSAILTALATGLPLIVKLIGTLTDRRVGTGER
jgi:hypothetical protein